MPLFEIVGRLAITDPMVALWWWCALCAGWLALRDAEPRHGWTAAFWAFTALLGLTKGPLLLGPPAIVAAWLLLAGRGREMLRLHPWFGLPLAVAPLAMVAWGFWGANPERAMAVWRHEFVDRLAGGRHDDPWWLIPLSFVAGLFPASAMLTLPWFNVSWRFAAAAMRAGDLRALLVVAVVLPLAGFSLLRGSSPTYVLPMVAPTALLVAMMLRRWVDGSAADAPAGTRLPDVRITAAVVMTTIGIGLPAATVVIVLRGKSPDWLPGWSLVWLAAPVILPMAASWLAVSLWPRREKRLMALAASFVASAVLWLGYHRAEDVAMRAMSTNAIAAAVPAGRPLAIIGLNNLGIDWRRGSWSHFWHDGPELDAWLTANPTGAVIVEERTLQRIESGGGKVAGRLAVSATFDAFMLKRVHVCDVAR
jgi:4-amino-4-deoxy-L-arabinose transferase-like glycosyltransferase